MIYKNLTLLDGSTMRGPWVVKHTEQGIPVLRNSATAVIVPLTSVLFAEPYPQDEECL